MRARARAHAHVRTRIHPSWQVPVFTGLEPDQWARVLPVFKFIEFEPVTKAEFHLMIIHTRECAHGSVRMQASSTHLFTSMPAKGARA